MSLRTISIGDLHGHDSWKKINPEKYDRIVFVADYLDSYTHSNTEILHNLKEIIRFKLEYPEKVVLLTGNHELPYFYFPHFTCEGFRAEARPAIQILFNDNKDFFQVAYQYKNYLWTHAGVSNKWLEEFIPLAEERGIWDDSTPLGDILNMANQTSLQEKLFQKSGKRMAYGDADTVGGIMWADRSETKRDYLGGFHQICGHTPIRKNVRRGNDESSITYIDSLGKPYGGFYELEI